MGTPPNLQGILQKKAIFLFFVHVRNDKNTTHVAKFAPSLGPVPLPPTPPQPKPLHPPRPPSQPFPDPFALELPSPLRPPNPLLQPRPLVYPPVHQASSGGYPPPTPQGILQNKSHFSSETIKIRHTLRNLLRPWGPCPYHLPPRNRSPCTPPGPAIAPTPPPTLSCSLPPRPPGQLRWVPPPPRRASFKKTPFFTLETTKIRHTLRNLLRPWGPCLYHLPRRNRSPCTPPRALAPPP